MPPPLNDREPPGSLERSPYELMNAILNRDLDKAADLIRRGADVNFVDAFGDSAMRLAIRMGLDPFADLLVQAGANVEERRHWESLRPQAELNSAVRREDLNAVVRSLDSGCDPNAPDESGASPLYWAVAENHPDILRLLLARGGNANARFKRRTALMHAIEVEALDATDLRRDDDFRTTLLSILIESGADVRATSEGFTPVQFAKLYGHAPAVALLLAHGAEG